MENTIVIARMAQEILEESNRIKKVFPHLDETILKLYSMYRLRIWQEDGLPIDSETMTQLLLLEVLNNLNKPVRKPEPVRKPDGSMNFEEGEK